MESWRSSRAAQICWGTLALLAGILGASLWQDHLDWIGIGIACMALPMLRLRLGLVVICLFWFGAWRATTAMLANTPLGPLVGSKVVMLARVGDDPGVSEYKGKTEVAFTAASVTINGRSTNRSVRIYTANYLELKRGYAVQVVGKLSQSKTTGAPQISFATVQIRSNHIGRLERLRQRFFAGMHNSLPDPMAGFGLGLLVGVRSLINKDLQETLNAVGLSHLVAVSGYNLTIIIQMTRKLAGRLSHFSAVAVSLWLIGGFLLVTGFSASIVRAAIVSATGLLIAYYGYEAHPITLLAVPAAITATWKPDYVIHDVGWQLSFLAFFGIVVIAPLFEKRFVVNPNMIKSLLIESSAAQLVTAPLIVGLFGSLSLISPLANVIILPLVPLAMLLGFGVGVTSMVSGWLGAYVALPAAGLLAMMIGIIQWFATWPHANLQLDSLPSFVLVAYGIIGVFTAVMHWKARGKTTTVRSQQVYFD